MNNTKRVVITGLGAVTPIGNSVQEFWQNAIQGKSGTRRIEKFNPELFKTQFAAEVKDFEPKLYLDRNEIRKVIYLHNLLCMQLLKLWKTQPLI